MAFEPKKFNELFEDMRVKTPPALTDFEVGSVTRTMYESFAYELGLLYQKMNLVYLSGFVDTAQGSHLDNVVAVLGIQRSLPDYAVGKVRFIRDKVATDITIPVGTLVATEETPAKPKKVYSTIDTVVLLKDQTEVEVNVQALERGQEQNADPETIVVMPRPIVGIKTVSNTEGVKVIGRQRETDDELRRRAKNALLSSGKANISALENAVLALQGVLDVRIIERFKPEAVDKNFGMVEVVVDAPEYDTISKTIVTAVENVRAAGVYALVRQSEKIILSGVFRIEVAAQLHFTTEERAAFELKVREAIEDFLRETKMGQPLLFSKMMKAILSVEGVEDLQKFSLVAQKKDGTAKTYPAEGDNNKIEALELERFYARQGDMPLIFVASENKDLPVNISFKTTGLDKGKNVEVQKAVKKLFEDAAIGATIDTVVLNTTIAEKVGDAVNNLTIQPISWREQPPYARLTTNYTPSFVEKAKIGEVFGYNDALNIDGAFLLAVPDTSTEEEKAVVRTAVQERIDRFLDALSPETNVIIDALVADIKKVKNVLDVQLDEKDWSVNRGGTVLSDRLNSGKIEVKAFEKAFQAPTFLVATDKSSVEITVESVGISILPNQGYPTANLNTDAKVIADKALFKNAIETFFINLTEGDDVKFGALQTTLQGVSIGFAFTVVALTVSDGVRTASLADIKDLKMRLSERAVLKPLTASFISIVPQTPQVRAVVGGG